MVDTPTLQKKYLELREKVGPYEKGETSVQPFNVYDTVQNVISSPKMYGVILVSIFLILLILRPSFLYVDVDDGKGGSTKELSINRFFLTWAVISLVLCLGFFGYNYRAKNQ
jgi:hypothetical protein